METLWSDCRTLSSSFKTMEEVISSMNASMVQNKAMVEDRCGRLGERINFMEENKRICVIGKKLIKNDSFNEDEVRQQIKEDLAERYGKRPSVKEMAWDIEMSVQNQKDSANSIPRDISKLNSDTLHELTDRTLKIIKEADSDMDRRIKENRATFGNRYKRLAKRINFMDENLEDEIKRRSRRRSKVSRKKQIPRDVNIFHQHNKEAAENIAENISKLNDANISDDSRDETFKIIKDSISDIKKRIRENREMFKERCQRLDKRIVFVDELFVDDNNVSSHGSDIESYRSQRLE